MISKKGQLSIEFVVSVIIVSFIFLFVLFLFFNKTEINSNFSKSFDAQNIADKISSNITNLSLNDSNLIIEDNIVWNGANKFIVFSKNTVEVWYDSNLFVDSTFFGNIDNQVVDFNGKIIFQRKENFVLVKNND
ncbi:MAG: hypothetical protein PHQ98_02410 [Candidatus ainarchaeum sp.]|nr:hypothetical protein [Candidatus ainarchaeum sp.]